MIKDEGQKEGKIDDDEEKERGRRWVNEPLLTS
jgi:hypothetical protein